MAAPTAVAPEEAQGGEDATSEEDEVYISRDPEDAEQPSHDYFTQSGVTVDSILRPWFARVQQFRDSNPPRKNRLVWSVAELAVVEMMSGYAIMPTVEGIEAFFLQNPQYRLRHRTLTAIRFKLSTM